MCGKFTQMMSYGELVRLSDLVGRTGGNDDRQETVTPMRFAHVIALDAKRLRRAVRMRWGLVPPDSADPMAFKPHIHARAETIDRKPTFRDAFAKRRGLVLVSTFNEGEEVTPTKTVQHVLRPKDGKPVAIAVVWERWSGRSEGAILSFAMVTVPANPLIATITDRMPALIAPEYWTIWLGEEAATAQELKAILRPSEREFDMRKADRPPPPAKTKKGRDQPTLF